MKLNIKRITLSELNKYRSLIYLLVYTFRNRYQTNEKGSIMVKQGATKMKQTVTAATKQRITCNVNRNMVYSNDTSVRSALAHKNRQSHNHLIIVSLLSLFLLPSALLSADAIPIYVWGFGDTLAEVFRAVSQLAEEKGAALTAVALSVGGIIVIFKFIGANGKPISSFDLVKYPMVVILLQQLFLSTSGSPQFMLIDETTNKPESVGRLPLGIGMSFSLFSNLQRSILEALDTFYTTPDSISFRNAGLGFGMSIHDAVATARPLNQSVMSSFNAYMDDCLVNESYANPIFKLSLQRSPNLMEAMKVNTNFVTTYYDQDGSVSVEYCPNAWEKITSSLTIESKRFFNQLASSMGYDTGAGANPSATEFGDKVGLVANHYFGMSQDAEAYVNQSMLANMNNQGIRTMSALSGINLSAMAWMPSYAERKAQSAFLTSGFMAKKYLPIMQMTLMSIIICVSWILALLTIATHNMQYIRLFITLILTISLWLVISSIMNFSFDLQLQKAIKSITYGVAAGAYQLDFKEALDSTVGDRLAMLGYISWLIPILAFGLAKGSDYAFAGLFSAMGQAFGVATNQASGAGADRQTSGGHSTYSPDKGIGYGSSGVGGSVHYFDGRIERHEAYSGEAGVGDNKIWTDDNGHSMQTITTQSGASWTKDLTSGQVVQANLTSFNPNVVDQQIARETSELNNSQTKAKSAQENWANTAQSSINDQVSNALSSKEGLQTAFAEADKNGYGDQYRIGFARATLKNWETISQHMESAEKASQFKQQVELAAQGDLNAARKVANSTNVIDAVNKSGRDTSPGDWTSGHGTQNQIGGNASASAGASASHSLTYDRSQTDNIGSSKGAGGSHLTTFAADYSASIAHELSLSKSHMAAYEESLAKTHSEAASRLNSHSTAYSEANTEALSHLDKISAMRTLGNSFSSNALASAMNNAAQQGISNDMFMGTMVDYISSGNYEAATSMVSGSNAHNNALTQVTQGAGAIGSATNNTDPNFANANLNADPKGAYNTTSGAVAGEYSVDDKVTQWQENVVPTAQNYFTPSGTEGANQQNLEKGTVQRYFEDVGKGAKNIARTVKNAFD